MIDIILNVDYIEKNYTIKLNSYVNTTVKDEKAKKLKHEMNWSVASDQLLKGLIMLEEINNKILEQTKEVIIGS